MGNYKARSQHATSKISVWWDMNDCPVPDGYDASQVRPSIEGELKNLGYNGPVTINAYGDLTQTPEQVLGGLSSTGVTVQHTPKELRCSYMYSDLMEWREHNPPPATIMLISDQVDSVFAFALCREQQIKYGYEIVIAHTRICYRFSYLNSSAKWLWGSLLLTDLKTPPREVESALLHCRSCRFDTQTLAMFTKHLFSEKHAQTETSVSQSASPTVGPEYQKSQIKRIPRRNYSAPPEYSTSKTGVWWDMRYCPVPHGYDAGLVRPSIEGALKNLGYNGPVTITAFGNITQTPEQVLRGLSSSGVAVHHTIEDKRCCLMFANLLKWRRHNPSPATIMIISDQIEKNFFYLCPVLQEFHGYKLVFAYASAPTQEDSVFVTSAEWLWESLLLKETPNLGLLKCSQRDGESTMFHCRSCYFDSQSLEIFTEHLSSEEHMQTDIDLHEFLRPSIEEYKVENSQKSKRLKKKSWKGCRFGNYLRLSNRRGARKSVIVPQVMSAYESQTRNTE